MSDNVKQLRKPTVDDQNKGAVGVIVAQLDFGELRECTTPGQRKVHLGTVLGAHVRQARIVPLGVNWKKVATFFQLGGK